MSHFQTYLELAVQERERCYVYDENWKEYWNVAKNFISDVVKFASEDYTIPIMKDLSPTLNTLKKKYNEYVFNLQNEYQEKIQKLLEEGEIEVKQGKQKNWDSSLLKYNTVLNQIKKQKTDALRPLKETIKEQKETIKKQKEQISKLKTASAKTKKLDLIKQAEERIEKAEQEIEKAEQNFNDMSTKVTDLFSERNNLIKEKTTSTQAEMDKINEKIKNNSETITKVVLGGWTALSFLANYYMWKLTGLGL